MTEGKTVCSFPLCCGGHNKNQFKVMSRSLQQMMVVTEALYYCKHRCYLSLLRDMYKIIKKSTLKSVFEEVYFHLTLNPGGVAVCM